MHFIKLIGLSFAMLVLVGCQSTPLQEKFVDPIPYKLNSEALERAIVEAGQFRGWIMTPVAEGKIRAELNIRTHKLVMDVQFSNQQLSLVYVESVNLDAKRGKIHRQYNNWVNNLRTDILQKLNMAAYRGSEAALTK